MFRIAYSVYKHSIPHQTPSVNVPVTFHAISEPQCSVTQSPGVYTIPCPFTPCRSVRLYRLTMPVYTNSLSPFTPAHGARFHHLPMSIYTTYPYPFTHRPGSIYTTSRVHLHPLRVSFHRVRPRSRLRSGRAARVTRGTWRTVLTASLQAAP